MNNLLSSTRDDVLKFINDRFPNDSAWCSGNCYYFATILQARFSSGIIFYDTINGHFVTEINGIKYDWNGIADNPSAKYIRWDEFDKYDSKQKERIIRDCIL